MKRDARWNLVRNPAFPSTKPRCAAMIARGLNSKNISLINYLAEWGATIAAIALVLGVVLATVRIAPAQHDPRLEKPSADAQRPSSALPSTGENLSQRLDRGDGVIKPPSDVDPQMHVAPKDGGAGATMPVIPPPSGGAVQPK
jgi:hypothetical protein